jgi:hypothetical protein
MSDQVVFALIGLTVLALVAMTAAAFLYVPPTLADEDEEEESMERRVA